MINFFAVRNCYHLAQPPSWKATPCRLSATAYSICSQLPSIAGGHSSIRYLGTLHAVMTGTHLSRTVTNSDTKTQKLVQHRRSLGSLLDRWALVMRTGFPALLSALGVCYSYCATCVCVCACVCTYIYIYKEVWLMLFSSYLLIPLL